MHPLGERLGARPAPRRRAPEERSPPRRRRRRWSPGRCGRPSCTETSPSSPIQSASAGSTSSRDTRRRSPRRAAVVRKIVAADDVDRAPRPPRGARRGPRRARRTRSTARRGWARSCAMSGCATLRRAGRRIVAIALLRDGQRDDVDGRIGDAREQRGARSRRGTTSRARRRSRAPSSPRRALLEHRIEPVLRRERRAMARGVLRLTPQMPQRGSPRSIVVGVDRLVRAVERAEAEMDDADAGLAECRSRARHDAPAARRQHRRGQRAARSSAHPWRQRHWSRQLVRCRVLVEHGPCFRLTPLPPADAP